MAGADDKLAVCQQTNQLGSQADRNTQSIKDAIASQSAMITSEFCALKERELQNKINTQSDIITQLRGQISNDNQTKQFYGMIAPLQSELAAIKAAQPSTITLPNTQYTVVPTWAANGATSFIASYWADRTASATNGTTTGGTATA